MVTRYISENTTRCALIVFFTLLALSIYLGRVFFGEEDVTAPDDTVWQLTMTALVSSTPGKTYLQSSRPLVRPYHNLVSQRYYHPGFKPVTVKQGGKRDYRLKAISEANGVFVAEYHVVVSHSDYVATDTPVLTPEERQLYLQDSDSFPFTLPSLVNLDKYLRQQAGNRDDLVRKIYHHVSELVLSDSLRYDKLDLVIKTNKATTLGRSRLMVTLLRANNIPARLVTGFLLEEGEYHRPHYWVELFDDDVEGWLAYDPEKGFSGKVPNNYLAFQYDNENLVTINEGKLRSIRFNTVEDTELYEALSLDRESSWADIFNLRRLDYDTRQTLIKILILPICVLIAAFFRHVIGFHPYGTFTAPLLSLAMVYTDFHITLIVSGIVLVIALFGRSILPKCVTRAPRLSLIFTFVSLSLVFSVSLLNYLSINVNSDVILIPIIILVALVDRFYSYMDNTGTSAALIRLGVTMFIAMVCVPVLQSKLLGVLLLHNPELHFITIALVLYASAYEGRKLTDNRYLRLLGENKSGKKKKKKSSDTDDAD